MWWFIRLQEKPIQSRWWTPAFFSWNTSSWAEFSCKTDIRFFFLPQCLFSPHRLTSHLWISHGLADNSWSPCHGPAAFNMNYKMASQAYQWMTDWMCMARGQRRVRAQWLPHSVNPRTGNASVARGRALHQHNVWHCLRQMLCWDVLLTFTTFWGETQACWYVQPRNISQSPLERIVQCVIQSSGRLKLTEKTEQKIHFLGIYCSFFCIFLIRDSRYWLECWKKCILMSVTPCCNPC